jgi:hypothetical protein
MDRTREIAAVFLLAMALTIAAGCGSGPSAIGASTAVSRPAPVRSGAEFAEKGGNNGPATFGKAAGREELEAAATVLEENLKARAKANFAVQCATLSASAAEKVEADAPNFGAGKGCVKGLRAEAEPLAQTKAVRADTLIHGVAVLRVKGKFGYALYHGPKGKDYAMLMEKESGDWKVARLATRVVP